MRRRVNSGKSRPQPAVNPPARFIVLRDQDSTPDCRVVKAKLLGLCAQAGRQAVSLVRIACHELESFCLADLRAVETALGLTGLVRHQNNARFRTVDRVESPSRELAKLTQRAYQKVSGSRRLGPHWDVTNDRSASFRNLIAGVRRLEQVLRPRRVGFEAAVPPSQPPSKARPAIAAPAPSRYRARA